MPKNHRNTVAKPEGLLYPAMPILATAASFASATLEKEKTSGHCSNESHDYANRTLLELQRGVGLSSIQSLAPMRSGSIWGPQVFRSTYYET
jgi:hypothetical protein